MMTDSNNSNLSPLPAALAGTAETSPVLTQSSTDELKEYLNARVIGQRKAVDTIVDIVWLALLRQAAMESGANLSELPRQQAIAIASSTGTGKTHLMKTLARKINADVEFVDASSLTGRGWKGFSIDDALLPIAQRQANNPEKLQIIVWDEFDKIALHGTAGGEDGSFNPAKDFLKLLDGGQIPLCLDASQRSSSSISINANNLFHVFVGAFTGIESIIAKRLGEDVRAGFNSRLIEKGDSDRLRSRIQPKDLEEWGIPRELVGRIGWIATMMPLDAGSMRCILADGEFSLQGKYQNLLERLGVEFVISDDACELIVRKAIDSGLGARFLESSLASIASKAISDAEASDAARITIVLSAEGNLSYRLEGARGQGSETSPQRLSTSQNDFKSIQLLQDSSTEALSESSQIIAQSINKATTPSNAFDGFVCTDQFNRAVSLLLDGCDWLPYPKVKHLTADLLISIAKLIRVAYGEQEHNLGNVYILVDGFSDDQNAFFGCLMQLKIKNAYADDWDEGIAWYLQILDEFDAFRAIDANMREKAIVNARYALRSTVYDDEHAKNVMLLLKTIGEQDW